MLFLSAPLLNLFFQVYSSPPLRVGLKGTATSSRLRFFFNLMTLA